MMYYDNSNNFKVQLPEFTYWTSQNTAHDQQDDKFKTSFPTGVGSLAQYFGGNGYYTVRKFMFCK